MTASETAIAMIELFLLTQNPTPPPRCHPSYPDVCLPVSRDVNCKDIPDNQKPVRVTGPDVHRLDSDKDGIGCEVKENGDRHDQ
jgi:hypothetical protein